MSDLKSGSSSEGASKSSKEQTEGAQLSVRSQNDPATSNAISRSFSESHSSPSDAADEVATAKQLSSQSLKPDTTGDNEEEYMSEEDQRPTITKRHSSQNHMNVYTECGRHGDEWLTKPIVQAVKSVFKK